MLTLRSGYAFRADGFKLLVDVEMLKIIELSTPKIFFELTRGTPRLLRAEGINGT